MQRRHFLRHLGALGAGAACSQLGMLSSYAATTPGDYKALVCVFMFGGNDGNNTLVPIDATGYTQYSTVRGSLALPQASLIPLIETGGSARFGLHPALTDLQALWSAGSLAILPNVGPLARPLSKSDYLSTTSPKPQSLFSHSDQQAQWQSAISTAPSNSGWGGRIVDQVGSLNAGVTLPAMISTSGPHLMMTGAVATALSVPTSGSFALRGIDTSATSTARMAAFNQLLGLDRDTQLTSAAQDVMQSAIANSAVLNPVLTATSTTSDGAFGGLTSSIAKQLLAVSKIIEARSTLGLRRQVFFVSFGSFDTHSNQLNAQATLLGQLGPALKAFASAMQSLGESTNVTTFTLSDFARTLQPNSNGGTDHAWGNHHFVMGGAVKGNAYYGNYPSLVLNGPDDAGAEGRWIPTTAVDQYAATLATWFGVSAQGLAAVLPNLSSFSTANLGFMS